MPKGRLGPQLTVMDARFVAAQRIPEEVFAYDPSSAPSLERPPPAAHKLGGEDGEGGGASGASQEEGGARRKPITPLIRSAVQHSVRWIRS